LLIQGCVDQTVIIDFLNDSLSGLESWAAIDIVIVRLILDNGRITALLSLACHINKALLSVMLCVQPAPFLVFSICIPHLSVMKMSQ